jgi:hypothetical protein
MGNHRWWQTPRSQERNVTVLTRLFSRASSRRDVPDVPDVPDSPERADLPHLSDQEAGAALALLRLLVAQHQATVYTRPSTPEGERPRWNVWDTTAGTGRRLEFEPCVMDLRCLKAAASADRRRSIEGTE